MLVFFQQNTHCWDDKTLFTITRLLRFFLKTPDFSSLTVLASGHFGSSVRVHHIFLWLRLFQTSGISMYIYVPLERKMKVLRTNSALSGRHRGEPWNKQCAILNWKLCFSNCTNFQCSFIFGIFSGQWFHRNQKETPKWEKCWVITTAPTDTEI